MGSPPATERGHLLFALPARGYFPGAWTAPVLLGLALALGVTLIKTRDDTAAVQS